MTQSLGVYTFQHLRNFHRKSKICFPIAAYFKELLFPFVTVEIKCWALNYNLSEDTPQYK